jgi:hypothetical protein
MIGPQCQCPHFKPTTLLMRAPGEGAAAAVRMKGPQWARTLPCAYGPDSEVPMRALRVTGRLWPGHGQVRLVSESQSELGQLAQVAP